MIEISVGTETALVETHDTSREWVLWAFNVFGVAA